MTELYTERDLRMWKRRRGVGWALLGAVAAAGLFLCVSLCARVTHVTAQSTEMRCILISVLFGWADMLFYDWELVWARRQYRHALLLRQKQTVVYEGEACLTKEWAGIPHSITVRKVTLVDEAGTHTFSLNGSYVKKFPKERRRMRLKTAAGFIVGYEVTA